MNSERPKRRRMAKELDPEPPFSKFKIDEELEVFYQGKWLGAVVNRLTSCEYLNYKSKAIHWFMYLKFLWFLVQKSDN